MDSIKIFTDGKIQEENITTSKQSTHIGQNLMEEIVSDIRILTRKLRFGQCRVPRNDLLSGTSESILNRQKRWKLSKVDGYILGVAYVGRMRSAWRLDVVRAYSVTARCRHWVTIAKATRDMDLSLHIKYLTCPARPPCMNM
ncbi:hypothetical protein J6590_057393 [Homalodisca vitripennis]|nr:hypothetical protein J6590_057393 [Homalodisca vitripennis]